jgi:hypothetical protein
MENIPMAKKGRISMQRCLVTLTEKIVSTKKMREAPVGQDGETTAPSVKAWRNLTQADDRTALLEAITTIHQGMTITARTARASKIAVDMDLRGEGHKTNPTTGPVVTMALASATIHPKKITEHGKNDPPPIKVNIAIAKRIQIPRTTERIIVNGTATITNTMGAGKTITKMTGMNGARTPRSLIGTMTSRTIVDGTMTTWTPILGAVTSTIMDWTMTTMTPIPGTMAIMATKRARTDGTTTNTRGTNPRQIMIQTKMEVLALGAERAGFTATEGRGRITVMARATLEVHHTTIAERSHQRMTEIQTKKLRGDDRPLINGNMFQCWTDGCFFIEILVRLVSLLCISSRC